MSEEFQGGYNPEDGMYYAKGSFDNENEYNNEIICLVNHSDNYFQELSKAVKEKRFSVVDQMTEEFIQLNKVNSESLDKLGAYEGDNSLLNTAKEYLSEINNLLTTVYTETINLIKSGESSQQDILAAQEQFGKRYQDITTKLSNALNNFLTTYGDNSEFDPAAGGYNPEDGQYYPKGSFDNEAEYYNEIIHLVNYKDQIINAIAQSLNAEEFKQVEELLDLFVQQNETSISNLKKLGDYEGDDNLLNASITYIKTLDQLVKNEYQEMFEIYKAEDRPMQEFQEKQAVFFEKIENADNLLADALEQFMAKYDTENIAQQTMESEQQPYTGMERKEYDVNNPYLQPIHGIALEDYAAASSKMANGMSEDQVAKALGVELPQWQEANQLWQQRMQQDTDMTVIGLFGELFAEAENHPKFQNLTDDSSVEANPENLARIKEDPNFYFDLFAAMQAAHKYGIDGAQWLRDNYGLSIGEFQGVAMQWAYSPEYINLMSQLPEKMKEHEDKFAAEMGGNVADDVEF